MIRMYNIVLSQWIKTLFLMNIIDLSTTFLVAGLAVR